MYLELNVYNWYTSMCSTRNWQAYRFRANWRLFSITIKTKCMYLLPVYVHPFSLFIYKKEADFYLEYKHIWNVSVKKKNGINRIFANAFIFHVIISFDFRLQIKQAPLLHCERFTVDELHDMGRSSIHGVGMVSAKANLELLNTIYM